MPADLAPSGDRAASRRGATALVLVALAGLAGGTVLNRTPGGDATSSAPAAVRRPPSSTSATTAPVHRSAITLSAIGDLSLGSTPRLPPDPATYLQSVATALAAPIVFGNLEGTITNATGSKCAATSNNCFAFRVPPAYGPILRQNGFTVLNSANNHSHDFGSRGVSDTSAALQAAGIAQTGLTGQIAIVTKGGTRVSFVGFAPYGNTNSMLKLDTARRLIAEAKEKSDVVVVYMHAGAEGAGADHVTGQEETYLGEDRGNAKAFAHAAIDAGANLVIASGPHVLRGMEFYKSDLIVYSLANFAGYQNIDVSGGLNRSGILRVTLDGSGRWQSGEFVSTLLDGDGHPTIDPNGAAAHFVAGLSTTDFGPAAATIAANGTITPPA